MSLQRHPRLGGGFLHQIEWSGADYFFSVNNLRDRAVRPVVIVEFDSNQIERPEREMIELHDSEGVSIFLRGEFMDDVPINDTGCRRDRVQYDLTLLPDGEYELVHRRSSRPAGFTYLNAEPAWQTIDGDMLIRTRIVLGAPPPTDAGISDAGP